MFAQDRRASKSAQERVDYAVLQEESASQLPAGSEKIFDYMLSILGFGLCRAWIVFCLAAPIIGGSRFSLSWIYLIAGAVCALCVSFLVHRLPEGVKHLRCVLFRVTAVALVLAAITIPGAFALSSEVLLMAGFTVGGVGAGLLQVLWGERFAYYELRFATLVSPAAAIITGVLVAFSAQVNFVGLAIVPLVSFGLLVLEADRTGLGYRQLLAFQGVTSTTAQTATAAVPLPNEAQTGAAENLVDTAVVTVEDSSVKDSAKYRGHAGGEVYKLMVSIMLFSFLCRIFDAMPQSGNDPFDFFGGSTLFALIVVGIVFLVFAFVLKRRFNPTFAYRLSLPIMVAGFVIIALFFDTHAAISILLINIGYEFFDILSWILFTEISRRKTETALHIFGLGVAFTFIGMSLGYLAGEMLRTLLIAGDIQITVVALLAILSLVVVAFLVIPEGTLGQLTNVVRSDKKEDRSVQGKASAVMAAPSTEISLEQRCATVAECYGLTPRESEVIVLLARGRTLAIIARDLQIAQGTARTHMENIYQKLDVHKQQELIDLVEHYEA
ncbi:MAG: LuxR C-terminal-related transcriptional regulator [Raoultibacter sp.]